MSAPHQLRAELTARLSRSKKRKGFSMTVLELERAVDAVERAIVAAALGELEHVTAALEAVSPWLRSATWRAALEAPIAGMELAAAA